MTASDGSGVLLAVLLNPPGSTPGTRTRAAVERAAEVLGYPAVEIANLCSVATPTVVELNALDNDHGWVDARHDLGRALRGAAGLLAGWGVAGMTGAARSAHQAQVSWLYREAAAFDIERIWMVGGEPRHPSRWHQYLSDKYARTSGGSFHNRLAEALVAVPVAPLGDGEP